MKRIIKKILFGKIVLITAFFIFFPYSVKGYIDPGTGSYFIQLVIAFIFGGLFAIKMFFSRIKKFFKNIISRKKK